MSDQYVRMQYSDDGGHNWSDWEEAAIGEVGQYAKKAVWTRLGSSYQRVYRWASSSPRKRDILGAAISMKGTIG